MILTLGSRALVTESDDYYIADTAAVIGSVIIKSGVSIWFSAVVRADNDIISIGKGSNIQDCCVLHTDKGCPLKIGEYVTVGHGAVLHGCMIGDNTLVGINSTVLNNSIIGENCIIGAGALISEDMVVPPGSVVLGVPGRISRKITTAEVSEISRGARHYIEKIRYYKQ